MDAGSEIRRGLEILLAPGQVFEVRSWTGDRISSGYFDDLTAAEKAIEALDAAGPDGIYLTPNPVLPDLLSRRANRIKGPLAKKDSSTSDADIIGRRWLLIDIDPARPSGVSSSEEEHAAALTRAADIAAALGERGWPAPVAGDSGNGAHLLYRLDLPNDDQVTALVKAALVALDALFSDPFASVDTAVFNASRIWKVYGTVARKGDNTTSRPHRRSRLISVPKTIEIVTREQLAALAITDPGGDTVAPAPSTKGTGRKAGEKIDLAGWLRDHGLGFSDRRPYQGGDLYRLDTCPFSSAHTDGAFAIQFASGAVYAGCHHASCGGGSQRWPELREMFEGPKRIPAGLANHDEKEVEWRKKKAEAREAAAGRDDSEPVEADAADEVILAEARQILEHGDPLAYMVDAFNLEHVGDRDLAKCLVLSLASRLIANSKGLHVMTSGDSGKGKSCGYQTMLEQVPAAFKLEGSFSDKSLYYSNDLRPRTVFFIDDKDLSESMQEVLKESTSSFQKPITHRTLSIDRKLQVCTIPQNCVWWIAKVEGTGDDQVLNRVLMVHVNNSAEQDQAVQQAAIERESRDDPPGEPHQVKACRAMWIHLDAAAQNPVVVSLSRFARRIVFSSARDRRNTEIFFDLIRSVTLIRFFQRDREELPDGTIRVYATPDDFRTANDVFNAIQKDSGSQGAKLNPREAGLLDVIDRTGRDEFTVQELARLTNLPDYTIRRAFTGIPGRTSAGLLEKCPACGILDRSVSSPDDTQGSARRNQTVFTFDRGIYAIWDRGCRVHLKPADGEDDVTPLHRHYTNVTQPCVKVTPAPEAADTQNNSLLSSVHKKEENVTQKQESTHPSNNNREITPGGVCAPPECVKVSGQNVESTPVPPNNKTSDGNAESNRTQTGVRFVSSSVNVQNAPPALDLAQVRAGDYSPIADGAIAETCPICSGRLVHYQEKFTAMKSRGGDHPRRLCRSCYTQAKEREQTAVQALPGAIPIDEVKPIASGLLGRCTVCGLQVATYSHVDSGTALCSVCYEKLVREQVEIR
ncbi:sigma-70 RNA polymerase sigma factor region 4 domain-containing protein [Methanosphaerula palustris]|uniref:Uncharacterized protein n=1 Tax=Methanosphaerula palustris (strain ATCC BAA-1556 / DSM 19958 / E1-9c) TaxID=521011 RepID=B8GDI1_METPE|nr:hypothetical protein [Methanosphaerula palustris]ACL17332.1 conserved hypothetical protein [Methanosphaerula palustris E1-9c]